MDFQLLGEVEDIEPIAVNLSVRERQKLKSRFGGGRWRKLKGVALARFPNGEVRRAEPTLVRGPRRGPTQDEGQTCSGLKAMFTTRKRVEFAICVANKGYDDLEVWKVYRVLPDARAAAVGCVRVIDESGEDYLYAADQFVTLDFPKDVRARLPRWQPSDEPHKALQPARKQRPPLNAGR